LGQLPIKILVLQAESRKTARACNKTTGFGTSSILYRYILKVKILKKNSALFLFFALLSIFLSCTSLSSNISAQETAVPFQTVTVVEPVWQQFADSIDFFHAKTLDPELEFWALRIGLDSPNIQIVVRGGAPSTNDVTLSTKVSSFVRDNDLLAGINTVPFDIITSREGQPIKKVGVVISGGRLIAPVNRNYDALVFYKDGKAAIVSQSSLQSTEGIENAAGGFHKILAEGEPAQRTQGREERHPRSAAGISANGSYLYLLVIDGRRAGSIGGTERETALILHSLGSWEGINFDGGGSSALALRYEDGRVRTVNTPIHGGFPNQERAVAGCLGVYLNPSREK
jgi:hypothetical protein